MIIESIHVLVSFVASAECSRTLHDVVAGLRNDAADELMEMFVLSLQYVEFSWKCRCHVMLPDPPKRHVGRRHADMS